MFVDFVVKYKHICALDFTIKKIGKVFTLTKVGPIAENQIS